MGRKRLLKDINSRNAVVRGYAERNAINAPIQGSADIIKVAMIDVHNAFQQENSVENAFTNVIDELVFDAHKDELEFIQSIIQQKWKMLFKYPFL